jgi:hypothetical protein
VPLALILWWIVKTRQEMGRRAELTFIVERDQQIRAGALAGGLATIAATLLINVVINLAGNLALSAPGTLIEHTAARLAFALAREVQPILLFIAVPLYLAVGVLWGALYGMWGAAFLPRWPDWCIGLIYAAVPLVVSLTVVMPLIGLGFFGAGATGPVAASGELVRHAAYGVLLGLLYPIFRARRPVKVLPHAPDELPPERVARVNA